MNKGYKPTTNDPDKKFSDGSPVNKFWKDHKAGIKEELETNPKYNISTR